VKDCDPGWVYALDQTGTSIGARRTAGKGTVFVSGFMPALSYIHKALAERDALGSPAPDDADPVQFNALGSFANLGPKDVSYNPWKYPAAERDLLLQPVELSGARRPVTINAPVVEAQYLEGAQGAVVTFANYSLSLIKGLQVRVAVPRTPSRVETVHGGPLAFSFADGAVNLTIPLWDTEIIKLYW
jgi:hypothetical protein